MLIIPCILSIQMTVHTKCRLQKVSLRNFQVVLTQGPLKFIMHSPLPLPPQKILANRQFILSWSSRMEWLSLLHSLMFYFPANSLPNVFGYVFKPLSDGHYNTRQAVGLTLI